jgi:hypothetical protein
MITSGNGNCDCSHSMEQLRGLGTLGISLLVHVANPRGFHWVLVRIAVVLDISGSSICTGCLMR